MSSDTRSRSVATADYIDLFDEIKREVRSARVQAARTVNIELIALYQRIGGLILDRQKEQGWGTNVIGRLSSDLRREFPRMTGLSATNLQYMRAFASAWPAAVSPQPVGKLPWGHIRTLLDRIDDQADRDWYAARADESGWSRKVLEHHIATDLRHRSAPDPAISKINSPLTIPTSPASSSRTPTSSTSWA